MPFEQTGYAEQVLAHRECMIGAGWQRIAANPAFANHFVRFVMMGHVDLDCVVVVVVGCSTENKFNFCLYEFASKMSLKLTLLML